MPGGQEQGAASEPDRVYVVGAIDKRRLGAAIKMLKDDIYAEPPVTSMGHKARSFPTEIEAKDWLTIVKKEEAVYRREPLKIQGYRKEVLEIPRPAPRSPRRKRQPQPMLPFTWEEKTAVAVEPKAETPDDAPEIPRPTVAPLSYEELQARDEAELTPAEVRTQKDAARREAVPPHADAGMVGFFRQHAVEGFDARSRIYWRERAEVLAKELARREGRGAKEQSDPPATPKAKKETRRKTFDIFSCPAGGERTFIATVEARGKDAAKTRARAEFPGRFAGMADMEIAAIPTPKSTAERARTYGDQGRADAKLWLVYRSKQTDPIYGVLAADEPAALEWVNQSHPAENRGRYTLRPDDGTAARMGPKLFITGPLAPPIQFKPDGRPVQ